MKSIPPRKWTTENCLIRCWAYCSDMVRRHVEQNVRAGIFNARNEDKSLQRQPRHHRSNWMETSRDRKHWLRFELNGPRKASVFDETRPASSTELLPHIWKKQNNWILFRKTSKYAARSILKKIEWPQRNNAEYDFVSMRKDSSVQDKEKDSTGMSFSADENMIAIRTPPLLRMCINSGLKERLSQDLHAMWSTPLSSFSEHRASWKRRVRKSHDSNARIFIVPWRPNDWIFREFRGV